MFTNNIRIRAVLRTAAIMASVFVCLFAIASFASAETATFGWNQIYFGQTYPGAPAFNQGDQDGSFYADTATADKVCQVKGYDSSSSFITDSYNSCGDNYYIQWTGSSWTQFSACQSNRQLQTLTCANAPVCTSHASKQCSGNSVYWYDSCGTKQDIYQACTSSQTCSNGQCQNITCSSNSDCGTNAFTGGLFCQGNSVYQNYTTHTCNNPGTANSTCSASTSPQLKNTCSSNQICSNGSCSSVTCSSNSDCGTNSYTGSPFCQSGNVYQNYTTHTCNNPGTSSSTCSASTEPQLKNTCSAGQTCSNGSCQNVNITCSSNSDCGTNAYTGNLFCQSGDVYQNYTTHTCNNPGTANSTCSASTEAKLKNTCSSGQTCSNGSCSQSCNSYSTQKCVGNSSYWYDSCGNQQDIIRNCSSLGQVCSNGQCICSGCQNNNTSHASQKCVGNNLYWYDSYGNQQELSQYCQNGCQNGYCSQNNNTSHAYQRCQGNNLYWYDSYGNQQELSQYCQNGCQNNSCTNGNNNYSNCTYHAYKLCFGNSVYWFDSCGSQQDLYQNCAGGNQTCQYGQCGAIQPYPYPYPPAPTPYIAHYRTACSSNNLYWYDSLGSATELYKNCSDANSCTSDACSGSKCSNTIKCDGSTCAAGSADYNSYCASNHCGNGSCEANLGETTSNCSSDCKASTSALTLSFLGKKDLLSPQWNKTIEVGSDSTAYFLINVINSSTSQVDNVNLSANIPSDISSIGNLKVNDIPVAGDIVSGINIGSVGAGSSKIITFEGKTQSINTAGSKQATATTNINGATQSDSFTLNLSAGQTAAVSGASSSSWLTEFLKRWYLWILVAIVLVFLFIVVFRRVSSN